MEQTPAVIVQAVPTVDTGSSYQFSFENFHRNIHILSTWIVTTVFNFQKNLIFLLCSSGFVGFVLTVC